MDINGTSKARRDVFSEDEVPVFCGESWGKVMETHGSFLEATPCYSPTKVQNLGQDRIVGVFFISHGTCEDLTISHSRLKARWECVRKWCMNFNRGNDKPMDGIHAEVEIHCLQTTNFMFNGVILVHL